MGGEAVRTPTALVANGFFPKAVWLWFVFLSSATVVKGENHRTFHGTSSPKIRQFGSIYPTESLENIVERAGKLRYPIDDYWKNFQDRIPESVPFPCDEADSEEKPKWRSETKPRSVHRLRPGDIDVVAAMGDSITSANGARELNPQATFVQDRGVSFTGGGIGTWRDITTIPNILKVYNRRLVGYALGRGDFLSHNAQLNVAIPAAIDDDMLNQAKLLVMKMKRHPSINFTSDWKLLSIFIGHNDVCSTYCFDRKKHSPEAHKYQLQRALDYLYNNVPRLFVNILSIIDPTVSTRIKTGRICDFVRRVACACLYRTNNFEESVLEMSQLVRKYQDVEKELVYGDRYDGREDFTVELQTFFKSMNGPKNHGDPEKKSLTRYMNEGKLWTPECFHFNQRGMAMVSIMLWNNMLEPAGNKSELFEEVTYEDIKCTTKKAPYLFTKNNSINYYKLGHQ